MNIRELGIVKMVRGLSKSPRTREYKEARIAFARLVAPLLAILLPTMVITILFVVTAVGAGAPKKGLEIEIASPIDDGDPLEPIETPPPVDDIIDPSVEVADFVDVALPQTPTECAAPMATVESAPPKEIRALAALKVPSPVMTRSVAAYDARGASVRARYLDGKGASGQIYGNAATDRR